MSAPCSMCGQPSTAEYRPFCSRRCADVDLARWLRGDYAIPGPASEVEEESLPGLDTSEQG